MIRVYPMGEETGDGITRSGDRSIGIDHRNSRAPLGSAPAPLGPLASEAIRPRDSTPGLRESFWRYAVMARPSREAGACRSTQGDDALLRSLPQPMHLYEYLTRSGHYHFGLFEGAKDTLEEAFDRMARYASRRLPAGGRILDVGCGLGGIAKLLSGMGHRVLALDPCLPAIRYAKAVRAHPNIEYRIGRFQDMERDLRIQRTLDGIVIVEALQHLPDPTTLFKRCQALLRPGGILVIHDVVTVPSLPWSRVPFHRLGTLSAEAVNLGFDAIETRRIGGHVLPTLDHLGRRLRSGRLTAPSWFGPNRTGVNRDMRELVSQWKALRRGFLDGDLTYETTVLRARDSRS